MSILKFTIFLSTFVFLLLDGDCKRPSIIRKTRTAVVVLKKNNVAIATIFFLEATVHRAVVCRASVRPRPVTPKRKRKM